MAGHFSAVALLAVLASNAVSAQNCGLYRGRRFLEFCAPVEDSTTATTTFTTTTTNTETSTTLTQPASNYSWDDCAPSSVAYVPEGYQPQGFPVYMDLSGDLTLPSSSVDALLVINRISNDCGQVIPVGRSYDGHDWEALPAMLVEFSCTQGSCTLVVDESRLPSNFGGFRVDARENDNTMTEGEALSRLMMQASFGPSRAAINDGLDTAGKSGDIGIETTDNGQSTAEAWITAQMAEEPTLLRSHFRKRVTPRVFDEAYAGRTVGPCEDGARFNRYVFDELDLGRIIEVQSDDDLETFTIKGAAGVIRTESVNFGNRGYGSGWPGECKCREDSMCERRGGDNDHQSWCYIESPLFCGDASDGYENDFWSANVCNVPNNPGASHILLHEGYECADWENEEWLGHQPSVEACAQRCRDYEGCQYFLYGQGDNDRCYMEGVQSDDCGPDGLYENDYNVYKLDDDTAVFRSAAAVELREGVYGLNETVRFQICRVSEPMGYIAVVPFGDDQTCENTAWAYFTNPLIEFASQPNDVQVYSASSVTVEQVWNLDAITLSGHTSGCNVTKQGGRVMIGIDHGNGTIIYYQHDQRLKLIENTPDSPSNNDNDEARGGRYGSCPSVPRHFLNEDSCVRREGSVCGDPSFTSVNMTLNADTLRAWYDLSTRYVYAIKGLRLEQNSRNYYPPCTLNAPTRWVQITSSGGCDALTSGPVGTVHDVPWGFFVNGSITIQVGDTVNWLFNVDDSLHNVVSGRREDGHDNLFRSAFMSSGSFRYTFNETGEYHYYCEPHPGMDAVITVQEASVDNSKTELSGGTADAVRDAIRANDGDNTSPTVRDVVVTKYATINENNTEYSHVLLREGVECNEYRGEIYFGEFDTLDECAQACRNQTLCKYFLYGVEDRDRENRCWMEDVTADNCGLEGFEIDPNYNFYKLNDTIDVNSCDNDASTIGSFVEVDGGCWRHSHPNEGNVYDFTRWSRHHPGNDELMDRYTLNPFLQTGEEGRVELGFPSWHDMWRWDNNAYSDENHIMYVGEYNGIVDFATLPLSMQTVEMADRVGSTTSYESIGFEACGSRGEVANDASLANRYWIYWPNGGSQGLDQQNQTYYWDGPGKHNAWSTVMLNAPDQLRQRVAWSLSQIITVGRNDLDIENKVEPWVTYYDIFTSNAFGNYRDILKEISASPLMGEYLTMMGNEAFAYSGSFPDENFAREIMQLFTIGLYKMNMDGTYKLNDKGERQNTYTNEDIMSFSRIWTGYEEQESRSNTEPQEWGRNLIDPMELYPARRDFFPKTLLGGASVGHIGDNYPLCNHLPPNHWMLQGAKYRFHGEESMFGRAHDNAEGSENIRDHLTLNATHSGLYAALCGSVTAPSGGQKCSYPPVVILDSDVACNGDECNIDMMRSVKIVDGDNVGYYTYVEPPCVKLQFFEGMRAEYTWSKVCADPTVATTHGVRCCSNPYTPGSEVCPQSHPYYENNYGNQWYGDLCYHEQSEWRDWKCPTGCEWAPDDDHPFCVLSSNTSAPCHLDIGGIISDLGRECVHVAEAMTFETAAERCAAEYNGGVVCPPWVHLSDSDEDGSSEDWRRSCGGFQYDWTDEPCELQVQVYPSGEISVVDRSSYSDHLQANGGSKFTVAWGGTPAGQRRNFPSFNYNCTDGCRVLSDEGGSCLCDAAIEDLPYVVTGSSLPSEADLRANLKIGASPPSLDSSYNLCTTALCTSQSGVINVYTRGSATPSELDIDTVFEFVSTPYTERPSTRKPAKYLLNRVSTVHVGRAKEYHLLNPFPVEVSSCSGSSSEDGEVCEMAYDMDIDRWDEWRTVEGENPIGSWLSLNFASTAEINMMAFSSPYYEHHRPKDIQLAFSDGTVQIVTLVNERPAQLVQFDSSITANSVNISVVSMYIVPCIFPFIYRNESYDECTDVHHDGLWCATELDENGVESDWGDCANDGINTVPGRQLEDAQTGISEIAFYEPGHVSVYSTTPCEDAGLLPVSAPECESAHAFLAERNGVEVREGDDAENEVLFRDDMPVGCSLHVGDRLEDGTFDGDMHSHWNRAEKVYDWDIDEWPVCYSLTNGAGSSDRTGFQFRNPPSFLTNAGENIYWIAGGTEHHPYGPDGDHLRAGAEHETAALLDHLFEHENTPPFVAYRMIQRMVSSNPSPRYVEAVATAFQDGEYGGTTYSGEYGDLAAMTAAILLDPEARSPTLDLDPTHGSLREPILKVLHMMKAMEFKSNADMEVDLFEMQDRLGQMAFDAPSVFSYFLPEFAPSGAIEDAGLVSPESQIATKPNTIGYLNGMASLVNYGLTHCDEGFGGDYSGQHCGQRAEENAAGHLSFKPTEPHHPENAVKEMAMLLSGGRLGTQTKKVMIESYTSFIGEQRLNLTDQIQHALYNSSIPEDECLHFVKNHLGVMHVNATCDASSDAEDCGYAMSEHYSWSWTVWTPSDEVIGSWIFLQFPETTSVDKFTFGSRGGSQTHYIKRIRLEFSDGTPSESVELAEDEYRHTYNLSGVINTSFVNITIEEIHTVACVFPFIYEGNTFYNCTDYDHDELWCATRVDEDGEESRWGNCNPDGATIRGDRTSGIRDVRFFTPDSVADPAEVQPYLSLTVGDDWTWIPPGCTYDPRDGEAHFNHHPTGCGSPNCGSYVSMVDDQGDLLWVTESSDDSDAWDMVDGNPYHCMDQDEHDDPWWQLDLGGSYNVTSIIVHNHPWWGGEHNSPFDVYLDGVMCAENIKTDTGSVDRVPCVGEGRVIRIVLPGEDRRVGLCEVEVNVLQYPDSNGYYIRNEEQEARALKAAMKLMTLAPEFHVTNLPQEVETEREPFVQEPSQNRPYKAVVVIYLEGGADSFNMVIPRSGCGVHDLYDEYATIRGNDPDGAFAIPRGNLLSIPANSSQPCDTFGLHPSLTHLQELYNAGEGVVLANVGPLVEPITLEDYNDWESQKRFPPGLYSHNSMQKDTWTVHSGKLDVKGMLGRVANELNDMESPMKTGLYSTDGYARMLDGGFLTPETIDPGREGVSRFREYSNLRQDIDNLTKYMSQSLFAEEYSTNLHRSIQSSEQFGADLEKVTLNSGRDFPEDNWLASQLEVVSKVMQLENSEGYDVERSSFYSSIGGFDTHGTVDIADLMIEINDGLAAFSAEMKDQGLWENVTVVIASEFGRTLSSNGQGSDHGWGGNYFAFGGDIAGRRMLGRYPTRLTEFISEANVGRGRFIPTSPWEALWEGVTEWMGLPEDARNRVLPNKPNFPNSTFWTKNDIYRS